MLKTRTKVKSHLKLEWFYLEELLNWRLHCNLLFPVFAWIGVFSSCWPWSSAWICSLQWRWLLKPGLPPRTTNTKPRVWHLEFLLKHDLCIFTSLSTSYGIDNQSWNDKIHKSGNGWFVQNPSHFWRKNLLRRGYKLLGK